jgi:hypothetical protein
LRIRIRILILSVYLAARLKTDNSACKISSSPLPKSHIEIAMEESKILALLSSNFFLGVHPFLLVFPPNRVILLLDCS